MLSEGVRIVINIFVGDEYRYYEAIREHLFDPDEWVYNARGAGDTRNAALANLNGDVATFERDTDWIPF